MAVSAVKLSVGYPCVQRQAVSAAAFAVCRIWRLIVGTCALLFAIGWSETSHAEGRVQLIKSFDHPLPNGAMPVAGLLKGTDGYLYGTTSQGGAGDGGTLFKIDPRTSVLTTLHKFTGLADGGSPYGKLVQGADGSLYGTTSFGGGTSTGGTIFRYNESELTTLHRFQCSFEGCQPRAGVIIGSDGRLYGTTYAGGQSNHGTVFKFDLNGTYTVLHAFAAGQDGAESVAALIQAADGNFYGTTNAGGIDTAGTVFKVSSSGAYSVLHQFTGANGGGYNPVAPLVQTADGNLYGTTAGGGTALRGVIFRVSTAGVVTTVHNFVPGEGANPNTPLTLGVDGLLYGTTPNCCSVAPATIFSFDGTATLTTLYTFSGPWSSRELLDGGDGYLYGVTNLGNYGTVFRVGTAANSPLTTLYDFGQGANDGAYPQTPLVQAADGSLFGTASQGGAYQQGSIYRIDPAGVFTVVHSFTGGEDGAAPYSGLLLHSDGDFYGTTVGGGDGYGTVFKITSAGVFSTIYRFEGGLAGQNPMGALIEGSDGSLYGETFQGGLGYGTIFRVTTTGVATILHRFTGDMGGSYPVGGLVITADGKLYGITQNGGTSDFGTVFTLATTGTFAILHYFDGVDGQQPQSLTKVSSGRIYGTTSGGGWGLGTIFRIDSPDVLTTVHMFGGADGAYPFAALIEASDQYLYGTTYGGGDTGMGVVFRMDPFEHVTAVHTFSGVDGKEPFAPLLELPDGSFYGTTIHGGESNAGTVFRFRNHAPTAQSDSVSTSEDNSRQIALVGSDLDGDPITFSIASGPTHGTLTGTSPALTYTPSPNYNGPDGFTFTTSDGLTNSVSATVSITVTAVNDAPVANGQSVTGTEDTNSTFTVAGTDIDADTLAFFVVSGPSHGMLSGTAPTFTYTPTANYSGSDVVTFKANDGTLDSNVAMVSITIAAVNDAPVATSRAIATSSGAAVSGTLIGSDVDSSSLTYSIVGNGSKGSVVLSNVSTGAFTYTPNAGASGIDVFTFKVSDGTLDSNVASVTVTIDSNHLPIASNASISTQEDRSVSGQLTATDADGNRLTYQIVSSPSKGAVTISNVSTGRFTYTPTANANGVDSFTFRASDGIGVSAPATVTVSITPVNDAPIAMSTSVTTRRNTQVTGTLAASDVDNDPLAFTLSRAARKGSVTVGSMGSFSYTPNANFTGSDSFTFAVSDGRTTATATVNVTVSP